MKRFAWLSIVFAAFGVGSDAPRYSAADRTRSIERGLRFIYRTACDPKNFTDWGHDYLWCFSCIASTSKNSALRRMASTMGGERARQWRREHVDVPAKASADYIANLAFGSYAADSLGARDNKFKERIRAAVPRFSAKDYLEFDPFTEGPPGDVPDTCSKCKARNKRGSVNCYRCGSRLRYLSRYGVWYDALTTAYSGDRFGITLGAPYAAVIRWLPTMRPYRGRDNGANPDFDDTIYAITHVVYTLNDYSKYRLPPEALPREFEFLKTNLKEAIATQDPETLGEFLDSLKSFGLKDDDPLIRAGTDYLISTQNPDGSWGEMDTADIYSRYHPTWTAIDGLRDYRWKKGAARTFSLLPRDSDDRGRIPGNPRIDSTPQPHQ